MNENLLARAFAYKKTKLWKELYDSEIIAVQHSDKKISYCSVMGRLGELIAVAIYLGEESFASFDQMQNSMLEDVDMLAAAYEQNCLMCSFMREEDVPHKDLLALLDYCTAHKIPHKSRRMLYPVFEKYEARIFPRLVNTKRDEKYIEEALGALIELSKSLDRMEDYYDSDESDGKFVMLVVTPDGYEWSSTPIPHVKDAYIYSITPDSELLEKARAAKKTKEVWQCDLCMCPAPIEKCRVSPKNKKYAAGFPMMTFVMNPDIDQRYNAMPSKFLQDYADQLFNEILNVIAIHGRPKKILAPSYRAVAFYKSLNDIGIVCDVQKDPCDELVDAEMEFMDKLMNAPRFHGDFDDPAAKIDKMIQQIEAFNDWDRFPDDGVLGIVEDNRDIFNQLSKTSQDLLMRQYFLRKQK